jgi:uncharacterized protein YjbI with pentapeptide repeats
MGANLREARIWGADLRRADLEGAYLRGANLDGAVLREANLFGAKMTTEQFAQATSLRGATLPDGTKLGSEGWEAELGAWREDAGDQEGRGAGA